jgi:hypothetical protein
MYSDQTNYLYQPAGILSECIYLRVNNTSNNESGILHKLHMCSNNLCTKYIFIIYYYALLKSKKAI